MNLNWGLGPVNLSWGCEFKLGPGACKLQEPGGLEAVTLNRGVGPVNLSWGLGT